MNKRDILLITPDFPPTTGGVAQYLSALASHLEGKIEVIAEPHLAWQEFDPNQSYPIYRMRLLYRNLWPRWLKTTKYLRSIKGRYRIILTSHVLPIGSAVMFAKRFTGVPYIVFVHGMDVRLAKSSWLKRRLARKVLKGAKLVVTNSQALSQELAKDFGAKESLVVYPCVPSPPQQRVQNDNESFDLITVSRLVRRKGHARVLNALSTLRKNGRIANVMYHIVGSGPFEQTLRTMALELSIDRHVKFYGQLSRDDREKLYEQSDLFVMPVVKDTRDKEGFGLVFIEAARHGVPSISTKISGVDEAIVDGQTGILLEDGDEKGLAQTIASLNADRGRLAELAEAARTRVGQNFTCEGQFAKLDPYL